MKILKNVGTSEELQNLWKKLIAHQKHVVSFPVLIHFYVLKLLTYFIRSVNGRQRVTAC